MNEILLTFFFIGGSFNLMIANWNCLENCVRFFGFGILNLGNINNQNSSQITLDTCPRKPQERWLCAGKIHLQKEIYWSSNQY